MKITQLALRILLIIAVPVLASEKEADSPNATARDAMALMAMATDTKTAPINEPLYDQTHRAPQLQARYPRYQLRSGDILNIHFAFTPEFDQTVSVQPDGFITLTQVGDIHVTGESVRNVSETLRMSYSRILREPVISVELKEFEKPSLMVFGEVHTPGKVELKGPTTVIEAVAAAGGFEPSAKHSQVLLFRRVSSQWIYVRAVDVKHMLNSRNLDEDALVQAGDLLFVPKNATSKIRPWIPYYGFGLNLSSNSAF